MLEQMALRQMEGFFVGMAFEEVCHILEEEGIDFQYDEPDDVSLAFISVSVQGLGDYRIEFDEEDVADSSYMALWED